MRWENFYYLQRLLSKMLSDNSLRTEHRSYFDQESIYVGKSESFLVLFSSRLLFAWHCSTINHVPCRYKHSQIFERSGEHFCALRELHSKYFSAPCSHISSRCTKLEHVTLSQLPLLLLSLLEICYVLTSTFISINLPTRLNLLQLFFLFPQPQQQQNREETITCNLIR